MINNEIKIYTNNVLTEMSIEGTTGYKKGYSGKIVLCGNGVKYSVQGAYDTTPRVESFAASFKDAIKEIKNHAGDKEVKKSKK